MFKNKSLISQKGSLIAVGLGPGDPGLLTLNGFNALQNANVIYYPASKLTESSVSSFSLNILESLGLSKELKAYYIPMNSPKRNTFYDEAFNAIWADYDKGNHVVIVSEGDILFYSTFGYLWKRIQSAGIPCELIPGIPAFIAAGATGSFPIVEGNHSLQVLSCPESNEDIHKKIILGSTLIVMKLTKLKDLLALLTEIEFPFLYVERVGMQNQFISNNPSEIAKRRIPYFSILIIYCN
jgi:precorrin-2/cobalt-factor-2 C20-methyltransferase